MACLPASLALFTSELLAERVVPVPFDGSTMVEGTDCPTIVSSADDAVRGNFVAGLEKLKTNQNLLIDNKKYSFAEQLATYLSLAVWEELRCFSATDRVLLGCPVWVSVLGVGLRSLSLLSPASSSSAQPRLYISTIFMRLHMNIFGLGQQIEKFGRTKEANKSLAVKDYF